MGLSRAWDALGRYGTVYVVGEAAAKGGTFLLLVVSALLIPPSDFAYLSIFIFLLGLFGMVVGLGLPDGLLRFHYAESAREDRIGTALLWIVMASVGVGALAVAISGPAASLLKVPPPLVAAAAVGAPAIALRQTWLTILRAERASRTYLAARIAEPVIVAVALGLAGLIGTTWGYMLLVVAFLSAPATIGIIGLGWLVRELRPRWTFIGAKRLLLYSVPLVPHALAMLGLAAYDQVVINQLIGAEAAGQYALSYRVAMAMYLVAFGVSAAWAPLAFQELERGREKELLPIGQTALNACIAVSIVLALSLPPIVALMAGPQYRQAAHLIPLIVYGYLWLVGYSLLVPHCLFHGSTKSLALASGTSLIANAGLNYLAIPYFGITAAAVTTILSYALLLLLVARTLVDRRSAFKTRDLVIRIALVAPLVGLASLVFEGLFSG
jgi:O-antigen/teichoic acid export membrane protein